MDNKKISSIMNAINVCYDKADEGGLDIQNVICIFNGERGASTVCHGKFNRGQALAALQVVCDTFRIKSFGELSELYGMMEANKQMNSLVNKVGVTPEVIDEIINGKGSKKFVGDLVKKMLAADLGIDADDLPDVPEDWDDD